MPDNNGTLRHFPGTSHLGMGVRVWGRLSAAFGDSPTGPTRCQQRAPCTQLARHTGFVDEQEAITAYLDPVIDAGPVSLLTAALRDARQAYSHNAIWLGAIGYLIVTEQMGRTIALRATRGERLGSRAASVAAMADLGPNRLDDEGRHALYDMRCAIAHQYGLHNESTASTRPSRVFAYTRSGTLVRLPEHPWDGSADGAVRLDMTTVVNLEALQQTIETMVDRARELHDRGELVLVDGVSPDEVPALLRMRIAASLEELKPG